MDDKKQDKVPERKDNNKDKYYEVQVTCNNNTQGEWDYNAWNLKIDAITSDSKCNIAFASNLSKEDYQNYIDAGIAYRRNTYRGKDLTDFFNNQKDEFYKQISEGTFDDIYVGDYIVSPTSNKTNGPKDVNNNTVIWLVADIDNYLYTGGDNHILTKHHLTIIPAVPLIKAQMNTTATTKGGYYGSKMVSGCNGEYEGDDIKTNISSCQSNSILDQVYSKYINSDFTTDHIISYENALSDVVTDGVSSRSTWIVGRKLDLMSEVNVTGTLIWSSSGHDTILDNHQYSLFHMKHEMIYSFNGVRFNYWLKDVGNTTNFVSVNVSGPTGGDHWASDSLGVRPRFLIG